MGTFLSIPILVLAAALQVTVAPQISLFGGRPDFVFLLVIAWTLNGTLEQSVIWALVGGICKDLLSAAPLGTSALGLVVIVFLLNALRSQFYTVGFFTLIWATVLGTIFTQALTLIVLILSGFGPAPAGLSLLGIISEELISNLLPTLFYHLAGIIPVYIIVRRLQNWANRGIRPT
jgi:rod shape-determining protein MreD